MDYAVAGLFLALGIGILAYTGTVFVEAGFGDGDALQNAALFPQIIACGLIFLSVATVGSVALGRQSRLSEDSAMPERNPALRRKAVLHLGLVAIYLGTLRHVGYDLATPIFLFAQFLLLGARWIEALVLGVAISLILALIFEQGLNVVFPVGQIGIGF